jgi:ribosomal protein S18 acetylase RimI-like enzyme
MPRIRDFQAADLPTLKEIMVAAFEGVSIDQGIERDFGLLQGHDWRWRKARHLDDDLRRDAAGIFVLEDGGRILGFVSTWQDREAGIGHIPNLSLVADCRGQGWGRKLVQYALDHFRRHGLRHAKIETLVQNEVGRNLYTSLGFREVARQVHFLADLEQTGES